jgi:hypothetical protein
MRRDAAEQLYPGSFVNHHRAHYALSYDFRSFTIQTLVKRL